MDWVVTQPPFLIDMMRSIITLQNVTIVDGILKEEDLPHLFDPLKKKYPALDPLKKQYPALDDEQGEGKLTILNCSLTALYNRRMAWLLVEGVAEV